MISSQMWGFLYTTAELQKPFSTYAILSNEALHHCLPAGILRQRCVHCSSGRFRGGLTRSITWPASHGANTLQPTKHRSPAFHHGDILDEIGQDADCATAAWSTKLDAEPSHLRAQPIDSLRPQPSEREVSMGWVSRAPLQEMALLWV